MTVQQQEKPRTVPLDRKAFHEILVRFNAETAENVDAAFCDALRFCDRLKLPFSDVARRTYSQDDRVVALESELAQAQRAAARIVEEQKNNSEKLRQEQSLNGRLREEIERLRTGRQFCLGCEKHRRALAIIAGLFLAVAWLRWFPWQTTEWPLLAGGGIVAIAPYAFIVCRWQWLLLSRKIKFRSLRDNEISRAVAERWRELSSRNNIYGQN
jgi:hypothetical protein